MSAKPLMPVNEFLTLTLAQLTLAPDQSIKPIQAAGHIAAETLRAPSPLPRANIALRAGFAVCARDTVGASAHTPVILPAMPVPVAVGGALPPLCDAIADSQTFVIDGAQTEIMEQISPGQHVRLAGHDLRQGDVIVRRGETITPAMVMTCELAGMSSLTVFMPGIYLAPHENPSRAWLEKMLAAQGAVMLEDDGQAALKIHWDEACVPSLALAPGEGIAIRSGQTPVTLLCPPRFDSVFALYAAILLPCLAAMTARTIHRHDTVIERKISSAIGMSEITLCVPSSNGMVPLSVGEVTLDAMLNANAFAIIPPHSEGFPAGTVISVISLHAPFAPAQKS